MRVKLQETPPDLWRRVAQRLESIRGTPLATGGDAAHLADAAYPIYRPDIKEVAYWEFEVVGLKTTKARGHEGRSSGGGFILASAGRHDVPIPHFSLDVEPPSRALEAKTKAGTVARIVKLDSLAYVAEAADGTYLTHLGQFPPKITGTGDPRAISTVTATPTQASKGDSAPTELKISRSGADVPKLKVEAWKSWQEAKRGFAESYKSQLQALAAHAAQSWAIEDLFVKFGEGIHEGQRLTVPLLKAGTAKVAGEGAKFVKLTQLDRRPPAVVLEALPSPTRGEFNFELLITYTDGTSETLPFFGIPKGSPSSNRGQFPHV
jgi:hypothetical protein